ncbi:MAG: SH3 domain-containing protein [Chloroflexi bacterium]|nr:SH3 domain-containing protein [Chloroflexota bacterium]
MLQQLGGFWRWLQAQPPALRVAMLATPVIVAALVVLGGLMVWSVARSAGAQPTPPTPAPAAAAQPNPTPTPRPGSQSVVVIATATSAPAAATLAPTQAVLVPGRDASPGAAVSPTPAASPTATSTPTPEPARSARIVNTEGQGANMRRAASVSAQRVKVVPEGTVVELVGGEQRGDGYTWRNVRDVDGSTGFVIVEYLQPIQSTPGQPALLPPPSIRVEEITSPAARGGEATLKIVTRPGTRCELRVFIFGPQTAPTDGLGFTTADADGFCSWTWKVPEDAIPGTWRYRISAGEGDGRATREVPIVIS